MSQQPAEQLPRPFGHYTLLKLLARGGMGEIYLARTAGLAEFEKYYAVKKLLAKFVKDPDVTTRFVDEAKLGARLGHPNIVQVYDLGRIQDELFMAAEFVDGFDLRRILRFCHEKNKRISLDIALFIVREILSGLAYAHRQVDANGKPIELVHRDISPQNVLVSFEGEVKIIDFGLAKSTQRSTETQANVLLGNFGYMSPEQARGKKLDVRTDVYSTGIVLFELVTGTKRFVDDNPLSLLEKVANPTPLLPSERVPGIPKEVDQLYARATAAKREDRFTDAAHFRDEISAILYKLNPRASREHLAEFLNYLFLGGKPPKEADKDFGSLNNSVSLRLGDLVSGSVMFTAGKDEDTGRMMDLGDKEPPTQTHAAMKSARLGDKIALHELFRGPPPGAPAAAPRPAPAPAPPPPRPAPAPAPAPSVAAEPQLLSDSALTPVDEDIIPVESEPTVKPLPAAVRNSDVTARVPIPAQPASFGTPASTSGRAPTTPPSPQPFARPATLPPGSRPPSSPPLSATAPTPPAMPAARVGTNGTHAAAPAPAPEPSPEPMPLELDVETIALDEETQPAPSAGEVPITRWSVSAAPRAGANAQPGQPANNPFQQGPQNAESLIIEFDEAEGKPAPQGAPANGPPSGFAPLQVAAPAAVPQPVVSAPPRPAPAVPRPVAPPPPVNVAPPPARAVPAAVVTDEGPPPVASVRPAMQPTRQVPAGIPPAAPIRAVPTKPPGSKDR